MEYDDPQLRDILKDSKMKLPFADFEVRMLAKITAYEKGKVQSLKNRQHATLFFLLGIILGSVLNYLLYANLDDFALSEAGKSYVTILSQLVYLILVILFSDKLWKYLALKRSM